MLSSERFHQCRSTCPFDWPFSSRPYVSVCAWRSLRSWISRPFGIPVGTAAVEKYSSILGLDKDQGPLVRTLYQGYRGAYREAVVASDKALASADGVEDRQDKMNKAMESLQRFADKTRSLEDQFFDDVRAVLTPEQTARMDGCSCSGGAMCRCDLHSSRERVWTCSTSWTNQGGTVGRAGLTVRRIRVGARPPDGREDACHEVSLGKADKITLNACRTLRWWRIIGDLYAIGGRVRDANRQFARRMEP